jgi:hypothetical protein
MTSRQRFWLERLVVLALTGLALAVRLYRLPEIPPGLYIDEAANGVDVLDILNGQFSIFFERNNGREPLFIYLQAMVAMLLSPTPFALRLTAALVGAATIPAVYWMVREAFAGEPESYLFAFHGLDVRAVWTALFLALSYWHLTLSRIGFRAILLPLMAAIPFAWFWRAWWRLRRATLPWTDVVLCRFSLGALPHLYFGAPCACSACASSGCRRSLPPRERNSSQPRARDSAGQNPSGVLQAEDTGAGLDPRGGADCGAPGRACFAPILAVLQGVSGRCRS